MTTIDHDRRRHGPSLATTSTTSDQQHDSATLGMWAFLATEVMFFGGLFAGFTVYRFTDPTASPLACRQLDVWARHDQHRRPADQQPDDGPGRPRRPGGATRKQQVRYLLLTMLLATTFLGIKAFEYYEEYEEHLVPGLQLQHRATLADPGRGATPAGRSSRRELFFVFYFFMTGLHALHMVIGIGLMAWMADPGPARPVHAATYHTPLELTGLYWHFVDIVWVFLFPLLYLIDLHK